MIVPANPPVVLPFKVIVSEAAAVIKPSLLLFVSVRSTINAFPVIVSLALATCKLKLPVLVVPMYISKEAPKLFAEFGSLPGPATPESA